MTRISAFNLPLDSQRQQAGFTLLEILLVFTIIGMAGVLIVPNIGSLESRSFNAQVRGAHNLLSYARRMAVVKGQPSTASFVIGSDGPQLDAMPIDVASRQWRSDDVAVRFVDSTQKESDIEDQIDVVFYPEGGSTGGTLLFTQNEQQAELIIDPFTGRIDFPSN